jgi:iron complex outermembrane receptor protein
MIFHPKPLVSAARWFALLTAVAIGSVAAQTQETSPPSSEAPAPEQVIVTGSYIPTAEGEGPLPVSTFTASDLLKLGAQTPAEGLRRLPSFVGNVQTENNSNQGFGTAGVNLRGLGSRNTLVLINGMRAGNPSILSSTNGNSGFQDINAIPLSAIDRVEVLKDGASATYGSDAVAGVANFILRTRFEGAEVRYLYGNTTNNDAGVNQASILTGYNAMNDRFHLVLDAEYYHRNALYSRDRFVSSNADKIRFGGQNGGSPTYNGRVTALLPGSPAPVELVTLGGVNSTVVPASAADYRAFNPKTDAYNFLATTPAIPEQELIHYYGATDYELFPKVLDLYALGLYAENRFYNGAAPSPGGLPALVANLSPYNPIPSNAAQGVPATQGIQALRYRATDLGIREVLQDHKDYHFALGARGDIGNIFHYDAAFGHDESKLVSSFSNDVRTSLLIAQIAPPGALSPALFQSALGLPLSEAQNAAALNATNGATYNPFIGAQAPTAGSKGPFSYNNAAALRRASYSAQTYVFDNQNYGTLNLNGNFLSSLPQGGFSVALGGEYRHESHEENDDPVLLLRDAQGFSAPGPFHASQNIYSVYGELNLPVVVPTMNIPGFYNLAFTAALRYQKYDLEGIDPLTILDAAGQRALQSRAIPRFGSGQSSMPSFDSTNPKFAFRWQPIQDVTLRGSYSTSFRAPSLIELFAPPVAGGSVPLLVDQGAPAGSLTRVQVSDTTTGNPSLEPEKTDSYSLGVVLSPRFAPGLNLTADYYQINQKNLILSGAGAAQFYLDSNFTSGQFADFVRRNPNGTLAGVSEQPVNAARRNIEGIDLTASYEWATQDWGKFNFALGWNHFFRFNAALSDTSGFTDLLGKFSDSPLTPGSIPYNKGLLTVDWQYRGFDFVSTVNYIGDYLDQPSAVNGSVLITPIEDTANPRYTRSRKVAAYTTLDLQLSYSFQKPEAPAASGGYSKDGKDGKSSAKEAAAPSVGTTWCQKLLGGTTLSVGCTNVFDREPPVAVGAFNDNYDTSLYSLRDRFIYGSITKKF